MGGWGHLASFALGTVRGGGEFFHSLCPWTSLTGALWWVIGASVLRQVIIRVSSGES